jgi:F-type H+-transporting ATPase subunit b
VEALGLVGKQIIANFIGFGLFLWLMQRFAWKPIIDFMDKRREEIAGNYQKIDDEKADLKKIREEYEAHLAKIEEEATQRIQAAIKQGQDAAREIEEQARGRAQGIVDKARTETKRVVEQAKLDLKDYIVEMGIQAGKNAARDTLDESTHRRLVEKFVEEMGSVR